MAPSSPPTSQPPSAGAQPDCPPADIEGGGTEGPDAGGPRPRRTVRVADLDKVLSELKRLGQRCDELERGVEQSMAAVASSRLSLNGIRALQQVAVQEQYPLGRALQRRLSTRLIERLKIPPPSGLNRSRDGASQRESRAKVVLKLDADADRRSMDELVEMLSLSFTLPGPGRREQASRHVQFSSATRLLDALGLSEDLRQWAMVRSFTRISDGSTPVRVIAERFDDDDGTSWFIFQRQANGDVRVACRETEEFDPQRRRFVYALRNITISSVELPGLPAMCPAYLRWRPSTAAALMIQDNGLACGRVSLSLPCCVIELGSEEVLRVLQEEQVRQQSPCD